MSAELAKTTRRAAREKANRLGGSTDPHKKVDASSWTPPPPLNTYRKTGARPLRARIYKHGGHVQGDRAPVHAGKMPRSAQASGGKVGGALSMTNVPEENKAEKGSFHVGAYKNGGAPKAGQDMAAMKAMKSGGEAKHWIAGAIKHPGALHKSLGVPEGKKIPEKKLEKAEHSDNPKTAKRARLAETLKGMHKADGGKVDVDTLHREYWHGKTQPDRRKEIMQQIRTTDGRRWKELNQEGDRSQRAHGGRAKGKTNINIVIAQPHGQQAPQMPMQGPTRPPLPPPMPPPQMPPPAAGGPPGMPPGAGGPPMMRKAGGRTLGSTYPIKDGAASGPGRLEKTRRAEKTYVRA